MSAVDFSPPIPRLQLFALWRRNFLVWRRLAGPSLAGHLADPVIFLFGLGVGVGALVGEINGMPYLNYIAAGMMAYGAMWATSFEALYSAFSRMHVQRTWDSILNTPMTLDDVVLAEWLWAGSKGLMSAAAILAVTSAFGLADSLWAILLIPAAFIFALSFAGIALMINALSPSYDFFNYYFTLFLTPMMMLSGLFFPIDVLPNALQTAAAILPLTHAVAISRALMSGDLSFAIILHFLPLILLAIIGVYFAVVMTRRRILK